MVLSKLHLDGILPVHSKIQDECNVGDICDQDKIVFRAILGPFVRYHLVMNIFVLSRQMIRLLAGDRLEICLDLLM